MTTSTGTRSSARSRWRSAPTSPRAPSSARGAANRHAIARTRVYLRCPGMVAALPRVRWRGGRHRRGRAPAARDAVRRGCAPDPPGAGDRAPRERRRPRSSPRSTSPWPGGCRCAPSTGCTPRPDAGWSATATTGPGTATCQRAVGDRARRGGRPAGGPGAACGHPAQRDAEPRERSRRGPARACGSAARCSRSCARRHRAASSTTRSALGAARALHDRAGTILRVLESGDIAVGDTWEELPALVPTTPPRPETRCPEGGYRVMGGDAGGNSVACVGARA